MVVSIECDNTEVEIPKGYKGKRCYFIHSYKGTGYYGFILLGKKIRNKLSLEDYRNFQSFIDKFIG